MLYSTEKYHASWMDSLKLGILLVQMPTLQVLRLNVLYLWTCNKIIYIDNIYVFGDVDGKDKR